MTLSVRRCLATRCSRRNLRMLSVVLAGGRRGLDRKSGIGIALPSNGEEEAWSARVYCVVARQRYAWGVAWTGSPGQTSRRPLRVAVKEAALLGNATAAVRSVHTQCAVVCRGGVAVAVARCRKVGGVAPVTRPVAWQRHIGSVICVASVRRCLATLCRGRGGGVGPVCACAVCRCQVMLGLEAWLRPEVRDRRCARCRALP